MKKVRDFAVMFVIQFFQYCLFSVSVRAMTQGRYAWTFVIDCIYGWSAFFIIKKVAQSESRVALTGYILGGAFGSLMAIYLTKKVWGV